VRPFVQVAREGRTLIFDGGMGTELERRCLHPGPEAGVAAPEVVQAVHQAYVQAGADVLLTNTLTANRLALERSGAADKVREYNSAGAAICRRAAAGRAYVAGDMSSTGQFLAPYGDYTEDQFLEVFSEQARVLADSGVDLIIIETMTDLAETILAVGACKSATSLPVIASMSFDPGAAGPRTMMGNDVESCARSLAEAGADVVGANCGGITPEQMAGIIAQMRGVTDLPLIAEPNAGLPELVGGRAVFRLPPEEFAEGAMRCVEAGAQLIGGCCGTTPAHIAALRKALDAKA